MGLPNKSHNGVGSPTPVFSQQTGEAVRECARHSCLSFAIISEIKEMVKAIQQANPNLLARYCGEAAPAAIVPGVGGGSPCPPVQARWPPFGTGRFIIAVRVRSRSPLEAPWQISS